MESVNQNLLSYSADRLGIALQPEQLDLLDRYLSLLDKWSLKLNLTAVKGERERVVRLLLDSLAIVPIIETESGRESGLRVMDLGTGAGLPGVPMKIVRPEWNMVLCESRCKKAVFLRTVVAELVLDGVEVFNKRAEEYARVGAPTPRLDAIVSRGVAEVGELAKICGRLVSPGGFVFCMKGPDPAEEVNAGKREIERAGLVWKRDHFYELPGGAGRRSVVVLERRFEE